MAIDLLEGIWSIPRQERKKSVYFAGSIDKFIT